MVNRLDRVTVAGAMMLAGVVAAPALAQDVTAAADDQFTVETVAEGLDFPWSIAFLPDGDMLVTELTGQLRLIDDGELVEAPISGTPEVIYGGQGGLSDVVLHPDFAANKLVYLTYSAARDKGNTLVVARAEFTGSALENFEVIFEADAYRSTLVHYGARMTFLPDGTFMVTSGDGFDYREQAQNTDNHFGAMLRLNDDGTVPADNPYVGDDGVRDEIYSYGHRNPQAIVYDASTGRIYENEHGAQGGDEINIIEPKGNYGWPLATYGLDYSGAYVSPLTEFEGSTQPLTYWTPSIAPSGMAVVSGEAFSDWEGDLLVTALAAGNVEAFADRNLRRVIIDDGELAGEEAIRVAVPDAEGDDTPRLRDVRMAPDGSIYVLTDGEGGHVLRLVPAGGMPGPAAALDDARDAVEEATQAVIEAMTEGAKAAAEAVEEAIEANKDDVAEAVSDAVEATAEAVKEGADAVKKAVSSDAAETPAE
jgi:glucose/arabinose dehydrogenase